MRARIREELSSSYGIAISSDDAERILHDGVLALNGSPLEDSRGTIQRLIDAHLVEMMNDAKSHGLSLNNSHLLFCGGGSLLCQEAILRIYPHATIDAEGDYANVMSYWRILEAKGLVQP